MANEIKSLTEQREDFNAEMQALIAGAKTENRSMTAEEIARFGEIEQGINAIDQTIAVEKRATLLACTVTEEETDDSASDEQVNAEERALVAYVKSRANGEKLEHRATNMTLGENGAVVPTSISNRIITAVKERSPILQGVTMYAVKGKLKIPVWGATDSGDNITVAFQKEFTAITSNAGKFTSVDLDGYLAGACVLIGKSVINNADVDILNFIINQMAEEIANFLEGILLNGGGSVQPEIEGALSTKTVVTTTAAALTADSLIELQASVPTVYQANACWTMHPTTFTAAKKLKDGAGQYILQNNMTLVNGFPYTILGKPVYLSDNMPAYEAGKTPILYGDYSGLSANMRESISVDVLNERYSDLHAVGVHAWFEIDAKMTHHQKLAALKVETA